MKPVARRSQRGMSLMEVMIAISILAVMALFTTQAITSAVKTRDLLAEKDETTRAARVALGQIRRQLQVSFLSQTPTAVATYYTLFVLEDESPDVLTFTSLSHQRLYRDTRESDQTEISIWAERANAEQGEGYVLLQRESQRIDEEPDKDGIIYPLAYNVRSFDVRLMDPRTNEWLDEWDTRGVDQSNRLPRAAQISLVLIAPDPKNSGRTVDVPFLTTTMLWFGEPLTQSLLTSGSQ